MLQCLSMCKVYVPAPARCTWSSGYLYRTHLLGIRDVLEVGRDNVLYWPQAVECSGKRVVQSDGTVYQEAAILKAKH